MKLNKKIILISPNTPGSYRSNKIIDENLALGYLAAILEKNKYDTKIIDARMYNLNAKEVFKKILSVDPFFIGVTMISEEGKDWILELNNLIAQRELTAHFCLGGYFPSLQSEKAMRLFNRVNSIVIGEGEITLINLISRIIRNKNWSNLLGTIIRKNDGKIEYNSRRPVIENLDILPFPKRYADKKTTEILIEGSRGCFGTCSFCAIDPHFGSNKKLAWRARSPQHIIKEMRLLKEKFPNNNRFRFIDPNFLGSSAPIHEKRIFKLVELIKKYLPNIEIYIETRIIDVKNEGLFAALKGVGLKEVYLGIESGSQKILNYMHKNTTIFQIEKVVEILNRQKINYQYGYMMVTPWTDDNDVRENINFLKKIGRVQFDKLFNELYLIPGTQVVNQALEIGPIKEETGTGYFMYDNNPIIKRIRMISETFDTRHLKFSEKMWYLYKDVQRHEQLEIPGYEILQQELSQIFINIFSYCFNMIKRRRIIQKDIDKITDSAITKYKPKLDKLAEKLTPNIKFPRNR